LIVIYISTFFLLGVSSFLLHFTIMEDKRRTMRPHSPSREGSSSPSSISIPPPVPPGSPLEVFSYSPCSCIFEQGRPSERILVVDLSSDEEDLIPDTSWDEEFTKRLFGDPNCELLGPPDEGKVIVLSDSDEEEEVREEDASDTEIVPSSVVKSTIPTASATDADDAPEGVQDDNNDGHTPNRAQGGSNGSGDEAGLP
jgi:hypothetical protein